jgi:hypothetical protein
MMTNNTENINLATEFERIEAAMDALKQEVRTLLTTMEPQPVDHDALVRWRGRDRYVLVRPDGERYWDIPGMRLHTTSYQQRPSAVRAAKFLPGCRIYDIRERTFVPVED